MMTQSRDTGLPAFMEKEMQFFQLHSEFVLQVFCKNKFQSLPLQAYLREERF